MFSSSTLSGTSSLHFLLWAWWCEPWTTKSEFYLGGTMIKLKRLIKIMYNRSFDKLILWKLGNELIMVSAEKFQLFVYLLLQACVHFFITQGISSKYLIWGWKSVAQSILSFYFSVLCVSYFLIVTVISLKCVVTCCIYWYFVSCYAKLEIIFCATFKVVAVGKHIMHH